MKWPERLEQTTKDFMSVNTICVKLDVFFFLVLFHFFPVSKCMHTYSFCAVHLSACWTRVYNTSFAYKMRPLAAYCHFRAASLKMLIGICFTVIISAWDGLNSRRIFFFITFVLVNSIGQWLRRSWPKHVTTGKCHFHVLFRQQSRSNHLCIWIKKERHQQEKENVWTTLKIDANNSEPQINPNEIMTAIKKNLENLIYHRTVAVLTHRCTRRLLCSWNAYFCTMSTLIELWF